LEGLPEKVGDQLARKSMSNEIGEMLAALLGYSIFQFSQMVG
jgi:hypothetical protein